MTQHCTIVSRDGHTAGFQRILEKWARREPGLAVHDGEIIEVNFAQGLVRLVIIKYIEPGGRFSQLALGMRTFALRIDENKGESVAAAILASNMLIGLTMEPDLGEEDPRGDFIYSIAGSLDGLIFNGEYFVDGKGDVLLK